MDSPRIGSPPRHVAIVMDGNGRWATQRGLPRLLGHKQGIEALVRTVSLMIDRGVEILTVYAFSTENWQRPAQEVQGLMGLVPTAMGLYLARLKREGVRVSVIGDRSSLPDRVRGAWERMEAETGSNHRLRLNVAFNYGGRWDVVQACRQALAAGVDPATLDESTLARLLCSADLPDPDLLIRTGGEMRLSNFLLWQLAYTELFFTDTLWPDFDAEDVDHALAFFLGRQRRFGGLGAGEGAPGTEPAPAVHPAAVG